MSPARRPVTVTVSFTPDLLFATVIDAVAGAADPAANPIVGPTVDNSNVALNNPDASLTDLVLDLGCTLDFDFNFIGFAPIIDLVVYYYYYRQVPSYYLGL